MGYIDRMFKSLLESLKVEKKHALWAIVSARFLVFVLVILLIFLVMGVLFVWFANESSTIQSAFGFNKTVLETANGILTPFITSTAVVTTFLAFLVQYQANQDLKHKSEEQRKDIQIERFEGKYYEMLRLHRANVEEMEIAGLHKGRRVFVKIYNEYRFIYQLLDKIITNDNGQVPDTWKAEISYHYCFWGVFSNTKPIVKDGLFRDYEGRLIKRLKEMREDFKEYKEELKEDRKNINHYPYKTDKKVKNELETEFTPFGGHTTRLGHYYRHLYQTIKMAASDKSLNKNDPKEEFETRYAYVKMLRVQLSNHEQALIYFNSFFIAGTIWWYDSDYKDPWNNDLSYFLDYAFIKNLPFNLTDNAGPDPVELFRKEIINRDYSEDYWQKSRFRNVNEKLDWLFEWRGG